MNFKIFFLNHEGFCVEYQPNRGNSSDVSRIPTYAHDNSEWGECYASTLVTLMVTTGGRKLYDMTGFNAYTYLGLKFYFHLSLISLPCFINVT